MIREVVEEKISKILEKKDVVVTRIALGKN